MLSSPYPFINVLLVECRSNLKVQEVTLLGRDDHEHGLHEPHMRLINEHQCLLLQSIVSERLVLPCVKHSLSRNRM